MIYANEMTMQKIRDSLRAGKGMDAVHAAWLRWRADEAKAVPSLCVTDYPSPAASGDPHDYFSEGPYWWPDPKNPDGPYIRRDGETNPERYDLHPKALGAVCRDSFYLLLASYHLGDECGWVERAMERMHAFFLDPATKMNPNMNHGQAIRNLTPGRCFGIIEAVCMHNLIFALDLCTQLGIENDTVTGTKAWLAEFNHWLRTSPIGIGERDSHNNHSMWYTSLVMALARLLGHDDEFAEDCGRFENHMRRQLDEEGKFIDEAKRTNGFGYCCYNLSAAATACEIAHFAGRDYWNTDFDGRSMSKAVIWLRQYFANPYKWPYKQINGAVGDAPMAMAAAAVRLTDEAGQNAAKAALRSRAAYNPYRDSILGPPLFHLD